MDIPNCGHLPNNRQESVHQPYLHGYNKKPTTHEQTPLYSEQQTAARAPTSNSPYNFTSINGQWAESYVNQDHKQINNIKLAYNRMKNRNCCNVCKSPDLDQSSKALAMQFSCWRTLGTCQRVLVAFLKSQQQIVWQIRREIKVVTVLLAKHFTVIFVFTLNIPSNGHLLVTDKLLVTDTSL